ncbi:hypothetical protein BSQ38_03565 [Pediococcus damnosus]|uniref:hypothetical protein n=1 Tax=Pediococcus damnosus TaxID=51663 RepID=UPI000C1CA30D|nr:hypothetical protein [Pediococcus damnosus]PIO80786.1 hypothetical protein BSQ38_03565 [Pediococcus damnosus]
MSDEMKELRMRLTNDCINCQEEGNMQMADGIKVALFEIDNLDKPYFGTDYWQGDDEDEQ